MTITVTRAMLSDAAARRTGISKTDTAAVGEAMFTMIAEALMAGENVKLTAFGSLQLRARAERVGRNPRTGTEHRIAARQTVVFTPSAQLRMALGQLASAPAAELRESA